MVGALMRIPISYSPQMDEAHVLSIVDFETCRECGEPWPCMLRTQARLVRV